MKTLLVMYVALVFLALSACKPKAEEQQAKVPALPGNCVVNQANCQTGLYNSPGYAPYNYNNNYGNNVYGGGYYAYGYSSGYQYGGYTNGPFQYLNNSAYLCNCQSGYVPTYNSYAGLGCVQSSGNNYAYAYFSWGANNNQWTNIPQVSNYQGYSNSGCYNGVVQSCLVDQPSTCSVGYSCRADSASSRLGLCLSNSGVSSNGSYGPVVR